jgi:predicted RNase H-like HicB family nuclease
VRLLLALAVEREHSFAHGLHWARSAGIFSGMATTKREFSVIIERDSDGYYVALVPELKGCHTQAKSLDTLMKRVREAIELCLEVEGDQAAMPEFVGVQRIAV